MRVICEEFDGVVFIDICLDEQEMGFVKEGIMACGSTRFESQNISIGVFHDICNKEKESNDYAIEEGEE
jgi:hypothetical protein